MSQSSDQGSLLFKSTSDLSQFILQLCFFCSCNSSLCQKCVNLLLSPHECGDDLLSCSQFSPPLSDLSATSFSLGSVSADLSGIVVVELSSLFSLAESFFVS